MDPTLISSSHSSSDVTGTETGTTSGSDFRAGSSSKRKRRRNFNSLPTGAGSLPNCVSQWKRQHVEDHLHIFYAKRYFKTPEDLKQNITGSVKELTKEQENYINFVNKHLTNINLSLTQFYRASSSVQGQMDQCRKHIENMEAEQESWPVMNAKAFIKLKEFMRALQKFWKRMQSLKKERHPSVGVIRGFIGKFADLCCLDVEYCNKADQVHWENLRGSKVVTSQPDLQLYKSGLQNNCPDDKLVSVMEIKPDSKYRGDLAERMEPPKEKRRKGNPRISSKDNTDQTLPQFEEGAIELDIHDKVLSQHAGELLLDLHMKYWRDEKGKYEGDKKINMLGMMVDGTSVYFTLLEMTWEHYQKLKQIDMPDLEQDDRATIYYSEAKDILLEYERSTLIADFMSLNNIEF